jgi:uncharacterized protein YjbJ (UPF0337 family)
MNYFVACPLSGRGPDRRIWPVKVPTAKEIIMAINSDTVEGTLNEFGGKAKSAVGSAFGDTKTQAEGAFTETKGKAQEAFGDAKAKVQDAYGKAKDAVNEWADNAPDYVQKARETGREYAEKGGEVVRSTVQDQPIATLVGGIAVGVLIGWLVSSRR